MQQLKRGNGWERVIASGRHVAMFTDGGCTVQDPRHPGGWAAVLIAIEDGSAACLMPVIDRRTGRPHVKEISGHTTNTTNNQMEIEAVIRGLWQLKHPGTQVLVVTDSLYVINTMTEGWKRKANHDRWAQLDALVAQHTVRWHWTKGHDTNDHEWSRWNNRAHALVEKERARAVLQKD